MPPETPYAATVQSAPAPGSSRLPRLALIFGIPLVILAVLGYALYHQFIYLKVVQLQPTAGNTISFGTSGDGEPHIAKTLLTSSSGLVSMRVKPGTYAAQFTAPDSQGQTTVYNVTKATTIKSPTLDFTTVKLQQLLATQVSAIQAVIANNPSSAGYTVTDGQLYKQGDWYAAKLVPSNQDTQDVLRIILNKQGNTWVVAAGFKLVFYVKAYPTIPADVIRDVNNR